MGFIWNLSWDLWEPSYLQEKCLEKCLEFVKEKSQSSLKIAP